MWLLSIFSVLLLSLIYSRFCCCFTSKFNLLLVFINITKTSIEKKYPTKLIIISSVFSESLMILIPIWWIITYLLLILFCSSFFTMISLIEGIFKQFKIIICREDNIIIK